MISVGDLDRTLDSVPFGVATEWQSEVISVGDLDLGERSDHGVGHPVAVRGDLRRRLGLYCTTTSVSSSRFVAVRGDLRRRLGPVENLP